MWNMLVRRYPNLQHEFQYTSVGHVAHLRRSEDGEVGRGVVVGGVDARGDHTGGEEWTPAKPG